MEVGSFITSPSCKTNVLMAGNVGSIGVSGLFYFKLVRQGPVRLFTTDA